MKKDIEKLVKYIDLYTKEVCTDLPTNDEFSAVAEYNACENEGQRSKYDIELIKRAKAKLTRVTKKIDYQKVKQIIYFNHEEIMEFLKQIEDNKNEHFFVSYNVRDFSVNSTILKKIGSLKDLIKFYAGKEKREKIGFTEAKLNDHFCNMIDFKFFPEKIVLDITPVNFRECVLFSSVALLRECGNLNALKHILNKKEFNLFKQIINDDNFIIHEIAVPVLDQINSLVGVNKKDGRIQDNKSS